MSFKRGRSPADVDTSAMVDAHAHFTGPSDADWEAFPEGGALVEQVGWAEDVGFSEVVFSVNPMTEGQDTQEPKAGYQTSVESLIEVASAIHTASPTFLPLAQVPWYEVESPSVDDLAAVIEAAVAGGFVGIGEIVVHGHQLDATSYAGVMTNEALVPFCEVAGRYDVPIVFHWDLLSVDAESEAAGATAAANRAQLLELLELLEGGVPGAAGMWNHRVKIVIAHCGDGPMQGAAEDILKQLDPSLAGSYAELLTTVLSRYPSVFFDLAGMQTEGKDPEDAEDGVEHLYTRNTSSGADELTPLGVLLADLMARYPTRFLFGTDGSPGESEALYKNQWVSSIPHYETFLTLAGLDDMWDAFFHDNAYEVLYSQPRVYEWGEWAPHPNTPSGSATIRSSATPGRGFTPPGALGGRPPRVRRASPVR